MKCITRTTCAITSGLAMATASPVTIDEFSRKSYAQHGWSIVNDGVMGGLSKGHSSVCPDGILTFKGTLSLDNNGGFSTVRSGRTDHDLSSHKGVKLRVRGDGRTYQLRFSTDARWRMRQIDFKAEFTAPAGKWNEVFIPFSSFIGTFRGKELPDSKFEPSKVRRIALLIADKKAGPFRLDIDWIRPADE